MKCKIVPGFPDDFKTRLDIVTRAARSRGWKFFDFQETPGLASYRKHYGGGPCRINVYISTMTVATALNHPKKGKTQLFRKRVSYPLLIQIFENPRVHTNKGYRQK